MEPGSKPGGGTNYNEVNVAQNEPKQVIVVRKDLKMRMGKVAAQSAHASMGALLNYSVQMYEGQLSINIEKPPVREWLEGRFTKVCVYVESEQELFEIYQRAIEAHLNTDRKSTRLNSSHTDISRMPSSA